MALAEEELPCWPHRTEERSPRPGHSRFTLRMVGIRAATVRSKACSIRGIFVPLRPWRPLQTERDRIELRLARLARLGHLHGARARRAQDRRVGVGEHGEDEREDR